MSRDDEFDWQAWKNKKRPIPRTMIEEFRGRFSCPTFVNILLAFDPNLTINDLQSRLEELGLRPTRIALCSLQRSFFRHVELLREAGLLIEDAPRVTTRFNQSKPSRAT
jgi:hypothetical protein